MPSDMLYLVSLLFMFSIVAAIDFWILGIWFNMLEITDVNVFPIIESVCIEWKSSFWWMLVLCEHIRLQELSDKVLIFDKQSPSNFIAKLEGLWLIHLSWVKNYKISFHSFVCLLLWATMAFVRFLHTAMLMLAKAMTAIELIWAHGEPQSSKCNRCCS